MKYTYLEGLRGYMSLWVLLYHASCFLPSVNTKNVFLDFFTNASLPVIVFMILSGFVTHILLQKNENYFFYLKRRAFRIFPIYLICFVASLLLLKFYLNTLEEIPFDSPKIYGRIKQIETYYNSSDKILNIISHLTLSHGIFPESRFPFTYSIMGQSWSLTLEWQFYIFIPFLYYFLNKKNRIQNAFLLLFFLVVMYISKTHHINQPSFLPNMIIYFLIGYFSLPLYKKFETSNNYCVFVFLSVICLVYLFFNWEISCLILLWGVVLFFQNNNNFLSDILLGSKIPQFLGKISYSIYCTHMIVLACLLALLQCIEINYGLYFSISMLFGGMFLTILISHYSYHYIELYFINLAKTKNSSKEGQTH
ncbi:acyltransferase family protein [Flavobacterium sp. GA093]|uniref:Acyltransferase family protein n=1 Tax=Flavobacterium hydrocarbonoxydans TaxID=2683249 RepID=A0A6I4NI93_9FLAO|nr:acyltransferase [Flavobacterium hydrocarbonoxydans]MWB93673.1 acyltransferase family protein [Flavobacterium hydrocarbonoxydans]